jgi:ABC-type multidrug transport system ATPase subunit
MADRLEKCYGNSPLFTNVTFEIKGGERVGVIGPNGCGKSTLINILLGNDKNYKGRARLGEWVRYGYLGQEVEFEDEGRTILEELLSSRDMEIGDARNYLARFQFYGDEADKKIEVLSGGEKVRLYLACMMLESPDCLIMDEPTNHLDVPARNALESAILEFGGTIIAVSHDRYFLNRCINRILEFSDGTLHSYEGNYDAYRLRRRGPEASVEMAGQRVNGSKPGAGSKPTGDYGRRAGVDDRSAGAKSGLNRSGSPGIQGRGNRPGGTGISAAGADSAEMFKKKEFERIEARIVELEKKQQQMESLFGPETPPTAYFEYDGLLKELDQLYGQLS